MSSLVWSWDALCFHSVIDCFAVVTLSLKCRSKLLYSVFSPLSGFKAIRVQLEYRFILEGLLCASSTHISRQEQRSATGMNIHFNYCRESYNMLDTYTLNDQFIGK